MAFVTCSQFKQSQDAQDTEIAQLSKQAQEQEETNQSQDTAITQIIEGTGENKIKLGVDRNDQAILQGSCLVTCEDYNDLDARLKRLASENSRLNDENSQLRSQLNQANSQISSLQSQLAACQAAKNSGTDSSSGGADINSTTPPSENERPAGISSNLERFSCSAELDVDGDYIPKGYWISVDKSYGDLSFVFKPYIIPDAIKVWRDQTLVLETAKIGFNAQRESSDGAFIPNSSTLDTEGASSPIISKANDVAVNIDINDSQHPSGTDTVQINIPVAKDTKYVFVEVLPSSNTGTKWNLKSTCPAHRVE